MPFNTIHTNARVFQFVFHASLHAIYNLNTSTHIATNIRKMDFFLHFTIVSVFFNALWVLLALSTFACSICAWLLFYLIFTTCCVSESKNGNLVYMCDFTILATDLMAWLLVVAGSAGSWMPPASSA